MDANLIKIIMNLLQRGYMDKEKKELRSIYNYYKDATKGFATRDGYYAVPSKGKSLAIVHNGEILKFCRNEQSARNFVDKMRKKK